MSINLANAPVSWGVDYAEDPKNPPWEKVMTEIADAGYRYTELGPYGYYPTDPARLRAEFERRGLRRPDKPPESSQAKHARRLQISR